MLFYLHNYLQKRLQMLAIELFPLSISQTTFEVFSFRLVKTMKEPVYKVKDGSKAHLFLSPCYVFLASAPVAAILHEISELVLKSWLH